MYPISCPCRIVKLLGPLNIQNNYRSECIFRIVVVSCRWLWIWSINRNLCFRESRTFFARPTHFFNKERFIETALSSCYKSFMFGMVIFFNLLSSFAFWVLLHCILPHYEILSCAPFLKASNVALARSVHWDRATWRLMPFLLVSFSNLSSSSAFPYSLLSSPIRWSIASAISFYLMLFSLPSFARFPSHQLLLRRSFLFLGVFFSLLESWNQ